MANAASAASGARLSGLSRIAPPGTPIRRAAARGRVCPGAGDPLADLPQRPLDSEQRTRPPPHCLGLAAESDARARQRARAHLLPLMENERAQRTYGVATAQPAPRRHGAGA